MSDRVIISNPGTRRIVLRRIVSRNPHRFDELAIESGSNGVDAERWALFADRAQDFIASGELELVTVAPRELKDAKGLIAKANKRELSNLLERHGHEPGVRDACVARYLELSRAEDDARDNGRYLDGGTDDAA